MTNSEDRIRQAKTRFLASTKDHLMTILRDDGVYRHVQFKAADTGLYRFDLVTWPGYLAVSGDMGHIMFSRLRDMFEFFTDRDTDGEPMVNPHYWEEKVCAGMSLVQDFNHSVVFEQVQQAMRERLEEVEYDPDDEFLDAETRDELDLQAHEIRERFAELAGEIYDATDEEECYAVLQEHPDEVGDDLYEWRFTTYTERYLWLCWAIVYGIRRYRERRDVW